MSVAELPIPMDREKIAEFCRARGIRKLSLFGSVLREDFDPARSDVDVLAEFEPEALKGVGLVISATARNCPPFSGQRWISARGCIR